MRTAWRNLITATRAHPGTSILSGIIDGRCAMPDIPTVHNVLGYVLTAWLSINAGIIIGAWWAAVHVERGER